MARSWTTINRSYFQSQINNYHLVLWLFILHVTSFSHYSTGSTRCHLEAQLRSGLEIQTMRFFFRRRKKQPERVEGVDSQVATEDIFVDEVADTVLITNRASQPRENREGQLSDLTLTHSISSPGKPTLWACTHTSYSAGQLAAISRRLRLHPFQPTTTIRGAHDRFACGLHECEHRFRHSLQSSNQGFKVHSAITVLRHRISFQEHTCNGLRALTHSISGALSQTKIISAIKEMCVAVNGDLKLCSHKRFWSPEVIAAYRPQLVTAHGDLTEAGRGAACMCLAGLEYREACQGCLEKARDGCSCSWRWELRVVQVGLTRSERPLEVQIILHVARNVGRLNGQAAAETDLAWVNVSETRWEE